jgi:hypothetical protein
MEKPTFRTSLSRSVIDNSFACFPGIEHFSGDFSNKKFSARNAAFTIDVVIKRIPTTLLKEQTAQFPSIAF